MPGIASRRFAEACTKNTECKHTFRCRGFLLPERRLLHRSDDFSLALPDFCARKMLFGLCFFHASIQEPHFVSLCILFAAFAYICNKFSWDLGLPYTSFPDCLIPSALAIPSVQSCPLCYQIQVFVLILTTLTTDVLNITMSALCLFQHNIVIPNSSCQERCTYGPLGWNIPSLRHGFTNMTPLCIHLQT